MAKGVKGQCYFFEGDGDCIEIPNSEVFDFGADDFSLSAWFRVGVETSFSFILNFRQNDNNPHIELYAGSDMGSHILPGFTRITYKEAGINDNKWHYATITMQNGVEDGYKLYLDGILIGKETYSGNLRDWDTITIGGQKKGGKKKYVFKGFIDEVAVYKKALSVEDIQQIYSSTIEEFRVSSGKADGKQEKSLTEKYADSLEEKIDVSIDKGKNGSRLSVQYAVMAVCEKAGVPYNWDKSVKLAEPKRRNFTKPINVKNRSAKHILSSILKPVGLSYEVDEEGLHLCKSESASNGSKAQRSKKKTVETKFDIVGKWESVDFVSSLDDFVVGEKQWRGRGGDLFLKELRCSANGKIDRLGTWKKGYIYDGDSDIRAKYYVKELDGEKYLFFPWLSGDVTERGEKPKYYVLKFVGKKRR